MNKEEKILKVRQMLELAGIIESNRSYLVDADDKAKKEKKIVKQVKEHLSKIEALVDINHSLQPSFEKDEMFDLTVNEYINKLSNRVNMVQENRYESSGFPKSLSDNEIVDLMIRRVFEKQEELRKDTAFQQERKILSYAGSKNKKEEKIFKDSILNYEKHNFSLYEMSSEQVEKTVKSMIKDGVDFRSRYVDLLELASYDKKSTLSFSQNKLFSGQISKKDKIDFFAEGNTSDMIKRMRKKMLSTSPSASVSKNDSPGM